MGHEIYGVHRVRGEPGVFPQRAQRLDPSLPITESELLIEVDRLNIDAASFRQIAEQVGGDRERMKETIRTIVRDRGKMHNPVTGSGGMLLGRVAQIGSNHPARQELSVGDRIASLVSLTLTPLALDEIVAIHSGDQVEVRGRAILFASALYAKMPTDLPAAVALAALDVCGAPALVARYVRPGMTVLVLGAGKSGMLCLAQARRSMAGQGLLIAADVSSATLDELSGIGLCDARMVADATDGLSVLEQVTRLSRGTLCDLAINCASVPNTEMATILSVRSGGRAIFFSMATSFTAAALGAEGLGKDVEMLIGNGFVPGHAELTIGLLRNEPGLRVLFERRYG
jgi:L-erythro-3,5-diaminohexanoate dehydrogenase